MKNKDGVIIETYILRIEKSFSDVEQLNKNPELYFISLSEVTSETQLSLFPGYVEGAIIIEYNGNRLINYSYWDCVDDLWSDILIITKDMLTEGKGETLFPDQPIPISMKRKSLNTFIFQVGEKSIELPLKIFLSKLLNEAEYFFKTIYTVYPNTFFLRQIKKIVEMRKLL